jgi:two-component system, LytTR family, sensor kinase
MKKWIKPTKDEWYSYIAIMPLLATFWNYLFYGDRLWNDANVWLYSFTIICVQGIFSWYAHIVVMHWLRKVFPDIRQTALRLAILSISHITLTYLTFFMLFYGYDAYHFLGYRLDNNVFKLAIIIAIGLTMVATTIWETNYTIAQWKESLAVKEMIEHDAFQQQFETLKSQVNPHFLFNCFNTLSSLIVVNPEGAEAFLDELSKVYRYLLKNNNDGLSTLHTEAKFIESYYKLIQTRHGDAVQIRTKIHKRYNDYLIPSLTLQLLIENAVKHNMASKESPLIIDIFTTAGNILVVTNNLQKKHTNVFSNHVGLKNIDLKFNLLKHPGLQVIEDDKNFTVVVPLLWAGSVNDEHKVLNKGITEEELS